MTLSNQPWSEIFREKADKYVDSEAAAQLLEDTKSAVLAQKCAALGDMAVNKAEQIVKASPDWHDHITKIVEARKQANRDKLDLEFCRMKFQEWINFEANHRVEMKL